MHGSALLVPVFGRLSPKIKLTLDQRRNDRGRERQEGGGIGKHNFTAGIQDLRVLLNMCCWRSGLIIKKCENHREGRKITKGIFMDLYEYFH